MKYDGVSGKEGPHAVQKFKHSGHLSPMHKHAMYTDADRHDGIKGMLKREGYEHECNGHIEEGAGIRNKIDKTSKM
jgi:hypothetical protein